MNKIIRVKGSVFSRLKFKAQVIVLAFLFVFSNSVLAEGLAENYEVDFVRVDRSGLGYVKFKTNLVGSAAACTQPGYEAALAFNTNEAGGKSVLALVLAAQASGRKVLARGTGACTVYGVMEEWNCGYIK